MTDKLSKVQAEVLGHMAQGHKMHGSAHAPPYLSGVPGKYGLSKNVHTNTWFALLKRGYIERADTDKTPWWRRDYVITDNGREKLNEEETSND